MFSSPIVAGVDLGGTYVRVALITAQGEVLSRSQAELVPQNGPAAGMDLLQRLIQDALYEAGQPSLAGIGIGATGPVDPLRGSIQNPYTLPTWDDVPIVAEMQNRFHIPVVLENDADVAALGEYWQGAGRGVSRLFAVTVGTGIGTAFLQDGRVYRGLDGVHPEGGHSLVDPAGPPCYCGLNGCWESLASGTAIGDYARQNLPAVPGLLIEMAGGDPAAVTGALVAQAAQAGDPFAKGVMQRAARYFSLGLINVIAFFVPDRIVLSGGVMRSLDVFQPELDAALLRYNQLVPSTRVQIMPARLGYEAGMIGAAYACLRALQPASE